MHQKKGEEKDPKGDLWNVVEEDIKVIGVTAGDT